MRLTSARMAIIKRLQTINTGEDVERRKPCNIVGGNVNWFSHYEELLLLLKQTEAVASVVSDSVRPHRRQPTRLPYPWDSTGKNTGVGCHFFLRCMKVKSESEVAQLYLTLSHPMDCNPPGSSVHGIFQARVLEWDAIAFSTMRNSMN